MTSIGDYAFAFCSSLTSIDIPKSVTSIGEGAFIDCGALTTMICRATTPPTCGDYVFYGVDKENCTLYVPEESVGLYMKADEWKEFLKIKGSDESAITAPNAVGADVLRSGIYDMGGRKLPAMRKGLNIVGGRKVMVK